jgi:acetolactate synthase-1/2/3 large subunit
MGVDKNTGLSFPDFMTLAAAHWIPYCVIPNHHYLKNILDITLAIEGPDMIEIKMSPDQPQAPRSVNRRNPDGTMNPTKLEDAYPFLPPEEVEECMSQNFWIETTQKTTWRMK